uniref:RNA polymerase II-associated protein 3-like isoform X2 n=1 Tax=Myxine glutinosa TaxID=7769 RepID=UPI0035903027
MGRGVRNIMDRCSWKGVSSRRGKPAVETLDFGYIEKCTNKQELENILVTLRSGDEGWYPDLTQFCEKRLELVAPESVLLHPTKPAVHVSELHGPQRRHIEAEIEEWQEAMQACAEHRVGDSSCIFEKDKLPPVRGKGDVAQSKELPESAGFKMSRRTCHTRSTDYRAWDKFDVDKECERIDLEPQAGKAKKTAMNRDLPRLDQRLDTTDVEKGFVAEREKNKGNEALRAMDYTEAVAYYTRSISALPTAAAYNNRALAKLKLELWHGTVEDCNHVLSLEPKNVKAFLRRCMALLSLGQLQEAQQDAIQALQIEPGHKHAQKLLHDMEKKVAVNTGVEVQRLQGRRLEVTDVGSSCKGDDDSNKYTASLDKLTSVNQQDHTNLTYQKCEDDDNVLVTLIPKRNEHCGTKLIVEMDKNERCEQSDSVTSSSFQENGLLALSSNMINGHKETQQECDDCRKVEQDAREKTSKCDSEIEVPHPIKSQTSAARKEYLNAKTAVDTEESSSPCSMNVAPELSAFEFGQHWQWCVSKGDIQGVAGLLQGVSPSHLPALLGTKLEGAGVRCALQAVHHLVNIQPDLAYQLLLNLTRTPRFQETHCDDPFPPPACHLRGTCWDRGGHAGPPFLDDQGSAWTPFCLQFPCLVSMFLSEDERKTVGELLEELDCASATTRYGAYDVAHLRQILDLA